VNEGWLERAGVRLHYLEWHPELGAREPALFLLHGLSSNARVWERVAAQQRERRVVALDQRSHGPSDGPPSGYATDELTADAAHAIRELDLGRPLVAGHSWGAAVAMDLAARHADLVSGLVIVDGPIGAMSTYATWEDIAQWMQPPLPTYADLDIASAAQAAYLGEAWGDDLRKFVEAGLVRTEAGYLPTLTASVRLEILRALYAYEPEALFPQVEGPLLLALARGDPRTPTGFAERRRRSAEAARVLRPDIQVRWFDSPHDIPLARPRELAADLERTALAASFWDVARRASALDGDWSRPAQGDPTGGGPVQAAATAEDAPLGWTAKDLLAHLSSTQRALAAIVTTPPEAPDAAREARPPFEPDGWNASQLRRRQDTPASALQVELREGAVSLQAALMEAELDAVTATGAYAGHRLDAALDAMAVHQRGHLGELVSALSLHG
jgi:pimeloyl-ACP methyl ester carboxylesterase